MSIENFKKYQETVEKSVLNTVEEIYKLKLKSVMISAYSCVSKCLTNPDSSRIEDENCIQRCLQKLDVANDVVSNIISQYTQSLSTCNQKCIDDVRFKDAVRENDSDALRKCDNCVQSCVQDFLKKKSAVISHIESDLNKALKS